jgi:transposase, IS5 family
VVGSINLCFGIGSLTFQKNLNHKNFLEKVDLRQCHSVFGRVRGRIGTSKLSKIFSLLRDQLKSQGYMSEVFTFVDATHLISKVDLRQCRYKRHTSVDMQSGMINKVAITSANVIDSKGFKHTAPNQGAVYADK